AKWRHMLGVALLLVTVVLWTASNFLASTLFADNTYSKPFFVTYVNTSFFIIPLIPILGRRLHQDPSQWTQIRDALSDVQGVITLRRFRKKASRYEQIADEEEDDEQPGANPPRHHRTVSQSLLVEDGPTPTTSTPLDPEPKDDPDRPLTLKETVKLSIEFSLLWFTANYLAAACLEYTTVASATILNSTSSIWTLLCGSLMGVERFTLRKLLGVLASLTGIVLISSVDLSGDTDKNRGSFPHKSHRELAIGDVMALVGAVVYGVYAVVMKKRIGHEGRVNMPLFFGLVGAINVLILWPGFVLLDLSGAEKFQLPPTARVTLIIAVNSATSLVSDLCWAYAMLFTSPLLVTVGLSLTIPLSLIGQMILENQYSSWLYWVGAVVVLLSFIFISNEEAKDE
ncbi:hypothetical protein P152DRAFT_378411, partial [Eremomyces bilateralis CBS 781.70]